MEETTTKQAPEPAPAFNVISCEAWEAVVAPAIDKGIAALAAQGDLGSAAQLRSAKALLEAARDACAPRTYKDLLAKLDQAVVKVATRAWSFGGMAGAWKLWGKPVDEAIEKVEPKKKAAKKKRSVKKAVKKKARTRKGGAS